MIIVASYDILIPTCNTDQVCCFQHCDLGTNNKLPNIKETGAGPKGPITPIT